MNTPHHGSAPKGTSRTADKFVVRMPDGMRELIAKHAEANHRSMNSEIVRRLDASLEGTELPASAETTSGQQGWVPTEGMLVTVNGMDGTFTIRGFFLGYAGTMVQLDALSDLVHQGERKTCALVDLIPVHIK